jgi:hypothetical protein
MYAFMSIDFRKTGLIKCNMCHLSICAFIQPSITVTNFRNGLTSPRGLGETAPNMH